MKKFVLCLFIFSIQKGITQISNFIPSENQYTIIEWVEKKYFPDNKDSGFSYGPDSTLYLEIEIHHSIDKNFKFYILPKGDCVLEWVKTDDNFITERNYESGKWKNQDSIFRINTPTYDFEISWNDTLGRQGYLVNEKVKWIYIKREILENECTTKNYFN